MTTRLHVATVLLGCAALVVAATPATATAPAGVAPTPPISSQMATWGSAAPLLGTPTGTLLGDGTLRTAAAPTVPVPLSAAIRDVVLGNHVRLTSPDGSLSVWATDTELVGGAVTSSSATLSVTLWRLDPSTGSLASRAVVGLDPATRMLGATGGAWVTTINGIDAQLWPFDAESPATAWSRAGAARLVAAGTSGLVYATADPTTRLHLDPLDGVDPVLVAELDGLAITSATPQVAMSLGAVGWIHGGHLGYWDAVSGASSADSPFTYTDVVVLPGTVVTRHVDDHGPLGTLRSWNFWTGVRNALAIDPLMTVGVGGPVRMWSGTSRDGRAAVGSVFRFQPSLDDASPAVMQWLWWTPGMPPYVVPAPSRLAAEVVGVAAGAGRVLIAYRNALGTGVRSTDALVASLRSTTSASLPAVLGLGHLAEGPATSPALMSVSGAFSSVLQYDHGPALWVRRGGSTVAIDRSLSDKVTITAIATSGPYTLYAASDHTVHLLRPDDPTRSWLPLLTSSGTGLIAQDGQYSAYQTTDGAVRLLDTGAARSSRNPRVVVGFGSQPVRAMWLSAGWLVAQYRGSDGQMRLFVGNVTRRTQRTVAIGPARTCDAMSGRIVACRTSTGQVQTMDVGATTLRFVTVAGAVAWSGLPVALSANKLLWVERSAGSYPTRVLAAPLPTASGSVGRPRLLGPWQSWGAVTSNASSSFCWRPQWTLSNPVTRWKLTLRSTTGRTVKTFTGTTADSVSGVAWCPGRTTPGNYRWTMTGTGPTGAPVATIGTATPTGTVRVVRQAAARIVPLTTTCNATTCLLRGRLVTAVGAKPLAGQGLYASYWTEGNAFYAFGPVRTDATGTATFRIPASTWSSYLTGGWQFHHPATPTSSFAMVNIPE